MSNQETTRIDARGMMCPRPIIELAKARRRSSGACSIDILADDLAFESDVRAWCEVTGNPLRRIAREGDEVHALIEFPTKD